MGERIIRYDLKQLEDVLKKAEIIKPEEYLNDAHIEPGELVIRVLSE